MTLLRMSVVDSPIGVWRVVSGPSGIVALGLEDAFAAARRSVGRRFPGACWVPESGGDTASALQAYFEGGIRALDRLAVDPGGTPFQALVWRRLREIPAGTTISYAELARRAGRPSAVRAAGAANALNPVAVVIPCHRVIGSDGSLTGYAGGIGRKRWLLEHERAANPPDSVAVPYREIRRTFSPCGGEPARRGRPRRP